MSGSSRTLWITLAVLFLTAPLLLIEGVASAKSERSYALVVGHNSSTDPNQAPLRYADDDAIRYFELFNIPVDVPSNVTRGTELSVNSLLKPKAVKIFLRAAKEAFSASFNSDAWKSAAKSINQRR